MFLKKAILTRLLPKTGQFLTHFSGDDGFYQAGWWRGKTIATNKTRFILKAINGDAVVIDRATGLMWAADGSAAGCLAVGTSIANSLIYAEALTFAGFSDWRVPNIKELFSIIDFGIATSPVIAEPPFSNTLITLPYHSGTVYPLYIDYSYTVNFVSGIVDTLTFGDLGLLRCVRGGL